MIAIYAHIPFCQSRCSYCTFASSVYNSKIADNYIECLAKEMVSNRSYLSTKKVQTIFIGGGTPSVMSLIQLKKILDIFAVFPNYKEFTVEANPESITKDKLKLLYDYGVNRLSIGVQTFSPVGLKTLGRGHDRHKALASVKMAQECGFKNINVDLISGWLGQGLKDLKEDLEIANALNIKHISCYNLILEEESKLKKYLEKNNLEVTSEDEFRDFWDLTVELLVKFGYEHYEISNFALPGFYCQHNIQYWKAGDYLGIGCSAHSHIKGVRYANADRLKDYMRMITEQNKAVVFEEKLDKEKKARETAVFWLRMAKGINKKEFYQTTGMHLEKLYNKELPELIKMGFLGWVKDNLQINKDYYALADEIFVELI